jgi:transcriptional regulator with XRE-family HTH domain
MQQHGKQQILQIVAANLREARLARKLSQREVGIAVGTTGPAISRWEAGRIEPGPAYRQALAELFFDGDVSALYRETERAA